MEQFQVNDIFQMQSYTKLEDLFEFNSVQWKHDKFTDFK